MLDVMLVIVISGSSIADVVTLPEEIICSAVGRRGDGHVCVARRKLIADIIRCAFQAALDTALDIHLYR